jgi:hypothetical protein
MSRVELSGFVFTSSMTMEEGACCCCCCVHISRNSCIEFLAYFTTFISSISSLAWVTGIRQIHQCRAFIKIHSHRLVRQDGYLPTSSQSQEVHIPTSGANLRDFVKHAGSLVMSVASADLREKYSKRALEVLAAMLWIDLLESMILGRVMRQARGGFPQAAAPNPTSNSTINDNRTGDSPSQALRPPQPFAMPMETLK